jgi:transposase
MRTHKTARAALFCGDLRIRHGQVTLQLLWEEHRAVHPDGYGYSRFHA